MSWPYPRVWVMKIKLLSRDRVLSSNNRNNHHLLPRESKAVDDGSLSRTGPVPVDVNDEELSVHKLSGLTPGNNQIDPRKLDASRFIRFHWYPLVMFTLSWSLSFYLV